MKGDDFELELKVSQDQVRALFARAKKYPWLLDTLAPRHRPGRYGTICSDEDPCRGTSFDTGSNGKDPCCARCLLLEAFEDYKQGNDVAEDFEIFVNIYYKEFRGEQH